MQKKSIGTQCMAILKEYRLNESELIGCTCCYFDAGEYVLQQGFPAENIYLVISGTTKIYMNARNGKNLILCYYISQGILGDIELMLGDYIALASSVAESPLVCLSIPISSNTNYLKNNAFFLNRLAEGLSQKLATSSYDRASSALYTSEERLCTYILRAEHGGLFSDVLTNVSQSVGISYRHMFRIINKLCDEGIMKKTKSGYRILDRNYLIDKATGQ